MNIFDCIVIGGGAAGLSTSLTLGRARRNIGLFDDGTNRNRVTQESHGFITRDGTKPHEFREIGLKELEKYSAISYFNTKITEIIKDNGKFIVRTEDDKEFIAEKIVLATGVQEVFPIPSVRGYYGKSIFSCPYCDGWEMREKPLVIIAEDEEYMLHMTKLVYNWSKDLVLVTNGVEISEGGALELQKRHIPIKMEPVKKLIGADGHLHEIEFESGETIARSGGFVVPRFYRPISFVEQLGCEIDGNGVVVTDGMGRTTQKNIYIAGETEKLVPSSLLISAAEGNKAAIAVNTDLTVERF
ncbi:NAD(P)/FAD-dependent oxidoreductase [Cytobacillus sp. IB215316]|uniref:NAD(P)/FAD-dependent oxidoreductase n=1 Tax=Cytobacillus sp. IB215316 TaxID=3097354 RepID=UPI002A17A523|nr:NAD(P)/FAD-dependent oxidoreductase [Cytobacillus sp. IB215316]MDX8360700.1 NAD(P)/FAD-dependent oxidoreductase [Cytobacillus sp. IB215316]